MFDGFSMFDVMVDGWGGPLRIHGVQGGDGPPLLLLHGFPETHAMWAPIAETLARTHTVIAPDLRGYGRSGLPGEVENHAAGSFRAMAQDQIALLDALGHGRVAVVGHDRGARVTHRLALDHPDRLTRLALLDIMPTAYVFAHLDRRVAIAYYHWFLYAQPAPLPEVLLGADPRFYLHQSLGAWGTGAGPTRPPEALATYEAAFDDSDRRHAMLEDYRAGASIDLIHDRESEEEGLRIAAPTLVLWGSNGVVGGYPLSPTEVWRGLVADGVAVRGQPVDGAGHFLVEDRPEATLAALEPFLAEAG